jgi:nitrite reductase/ring-hydroxylating ferredoxin subunit
MDEAGRTGVQEPQISMPNVTATEITVVGEQPDLVRRIFDGEVLVLRRGLQQVGQFDTMVRATLSGIRLAKGDEIAAQVERAGFDRIHEFVAAGDLPALTDAVYRRMEPVAHDVLDALVPRFFPEGGAYYYERSPNVRFHIPYDLAAKHQREFNKFAEKSGQGKIAAHGPHRDQWVDCPDNAINVWIAIGPVRQGNSLTVFAEEYHNHFAFKDGYIENGVSLRRPLSFDLEPGDAVLFRSNHLHGSELNRTNRTRYVVSFRVTFGKPHYPHGHYHHYLHGGLARGPFRALAAVPQNLQMSFVRYQFRRLRYKITGKGRMSGADGESVVSAPSRDTWGPEASIALTDLPVGTIRPIAKNVCVARLAENEFVALSRYCPHAGGDLTGGWIDAGQVVCPMHSLTFDSSTGASPCASLRALRRYPVSVRDGRVVVSEDGALDRHQDDDAARVTQ